MKRPTIILAAANIVFICIIYILLQIGQKAQRTYIYSVLKGFESDGLLTTNANHVIEIPPGSSLMKLNPLRSAHVVVVAVCMLWGLFSTVLLFAQRPVTSVPGPLEENLRANQGKSSGKGN